MHTRDYTPYKAAIRSHTSQSWYGTNRANNINGDYLGLCQVSRRRSIIKRKLSATVGSDPTASNGQDSSDSQSLEPINGPEGFPHIELTLWLHGSFNGVRMA